MKYGDGHEFLVDRDLEGSNCGKSQTLTQVSQWLAKIQIGYL
jgi:hypothetical protein